MKRPLFVALLFFWGLVLPGVELSAELDTGTPWNAVFPGREAQSAFLLRNTGGSAKNVQVQLTMTDVNGNILYVLEHPASAIPAGESLRLPLRPWDKYGFYQVAYRVSGDLALEGKLSCVFMKPAGPAEKKRGGFSFGVHMHSERYPEAEQRIMARAAGACGINLARIQVKWWMCEPEQGRGFRFDGAERYLRIIEEQNIEPMIQIAGIQKWGVDPNWKPLRDFPDQRIWNALPEVKQYAAFTRATVGHFRGRFRYLEIGNEPDLLLFANYSLKDYITLLNGAYRAAKDETPEIQVMNGGFATVTYHDLAVEPDYVRNFLRQTRGKGYDVLAVHFHSDYLYYRKCLDEFLEMKAEFAPETPWYPNETAYSSAAGWCTELEQAYTLWKKLLYSWTRGAEGYVWYNFRSKPEYPKGHSEYEYGLLTGEFLPKPAYAAYNTLIAHFAGAQFIRVLSEKGADRELYLFRAANGDWLIPFWGNTADSRPVLLSAEGRNLQLFDLWGNGKNVERSKNHTVCVEPALQPALLRYSGPEPVLIGNFLTPGQEIVIAENVPGEFTLTVNNPLREELQGTLALRAPGGISVTPSACRFRIAGGGQEAFHFAIAADRPIRPQEDQLTVFCHAAPLWEGSIRRKISGVTFLKAEFEDLPDFVLEERSQTHTFFPNAPDTSHLFWSGPEDLSARIFTAVSDGKMKVRIEVLDDVHRQKHAGSEIWRGDSVQLAIAVPRQQGSWKFGVALREDGVTETFCWETPEGFAKERLRRAIKSSIQRDEAKKTTLYLLSFPLTELGIGRKTAENGFRFNLLVNDDDGEGRESLIRIADGFGTGVEDLTILPELRCPAR